MNIKKSLKKNISLKNLDGGAVARGGVATSEDSNSSSPSKNKIILALIGLGIGTVGANKIHKSIKNGRSRRIQEEALNYLSKNKNTEKEFKRLDKLLRINKEFILNALIKDYKVWNYIEDEKIKNDTTFIINILDKNPKLWDLIEAIIFL